MAALLRLKLRAQPQGLQGWKHRLIAGDAAQRREACEGGQIGHRHFPQLKAVQPGRVPQGCQSGQRRMKQGKGCLLYTSPSPRDCS